MRDSILKRLPALSLGAKATLAVITLLSVMALVLGALFGYYQRRSQMDRLHEKAVAFAGNLAFNCNFALLSKDRARLEQLVTGVRLEKDVVLVLVADSAGQVLASTDPPLLGTRLAYLSGPSAPDSSLWQTVRASSRYRAVAPVSALGAASGPEMDESMFFAPGGAQTNGTHERLGWAVIEVSPARLNAELARSLRWAGLLFLLILALASSLAIVSVRRTVAPLHLLAEATRQIAHGEFGRTIPAAGRDELGVLSESFNEMSLRLQRSRQEVEQLNTELETRISESTTELRNRYRELENVCFELRNLDSAKNDFLSLVSHEFRTPLGSIQLFSEMLLKGLDRSDTRRTDFLLTIINNCKRLTRLINEILDISRIEAGRMEFSRETFDLKETLYSTIFSLKPLFEERSIACSFASPENPVRLHSDRDRIIQVLTNLLSNAIRFSPPGSVVEVGLGEANGRAQVSVLDHGRGMRQEDIPKIFDKYAQLERIKPDSEGSGLGMTIAKLIVNNLDGTIRVESAPGRGSCFTVDFPTVRPEVEKQS